MDKLAAFIQHDDAFLRATLPVPPELCGNRHGKNARGFIVRELLDRLRWRQAMIEREKISWHWPVLRLFAQRQKGGGGKVVFVFRQNRGYRVYFGRDGATVVLLLTGGTKKRQQRDIEAASACDAEQRAEMARTKSLKDLVRKHVKADKKFAEALLREGVGAIAQRRRGYRKEILRDYIKATVVSKSSARRLARRRRA